MSALFEYEQYMPHGMCLLWEPWLVLLWSGSDLMIFASYMAIPLAIMMVLRRRPELTHRGLVSLFAAFILLCGFTHALSIVTLWTPIYPLVGTVKLATGLVSLVAAVVLFRLIPAFVRIPTPDRHEEVIAQLEMTLADLSRTRDELESRVDQRTSALNKANEQLAFTASDAVQRSRNLIQVVSSLTRPGVDVSEYSASFLSELRGRINALAIATSTVMEQGVRGRAVIERVVRRQVEPLLADPDKQLTTEGPAVEIGAQGAQQISLIAWELGSRYARLSRQIQSDARIHVIWMIERESGQESQLKFEWREILTPPNERDDQLDETANITRTPDPLPDFSETLLIRIVPRMLGGKGRVDIEDSTFIYRLRCPLSTLDNSLDIEAELFETGVIKQYVGGGLAGKA